MSEVTITTNFDVSSLGVSLLMGYLAVLVVISIFFIVVQWKIFKKANKPGWAALVPIYNMIVLYQIAGVKLVYLLLNFIPVVNIFAALILLIMVSVRLAHSFGKSTGFGIGLWLVPFIFYPILAFSKCKYVGPNGTVQFDAPQPTSSDYSKPQNYKDPDALNQPSKEPEISMGSGQVFHSAPIEPVVQPSNESVIPNKIPDFGASTPLNNTSEPSNTPVADITPVVENKVADIEQPQNISIPEVGVNPVVTPVVQSTNESVVPNNIPDFGASTPVNNNSEPSNTPVADINPVVPSVEPVQPAEPVQQPVEIVDNPTEKQGSFILPEINQEETSTPVLTPPAAPTKASFIPDAEVSTTNKETKTCPNCGATVDANSTVCFLCGKNI